MAVQNLQNFSFTEKLLALLIVVELLSNQLQNEKIINELKTAE